jgi:tetratricopeptide (TPR) repeat protein
MARPGLARPAGQRQPSTLMTDTPPLAGQVIVVAGSLSRLTRRELTSLVERQSGRVQPTVTRDTTMLVRGDELAADLQVRGGASARPAAESASTADERRLAEAERLNARYPGRVRILSEREFLHLAGLPEPDESTALYGARSLRGLYPALRDDHLRYLERWGLVRPVRKTRQERFYRFADLAVIRQASAELARGHAFRSVLRGLVAEREGQLALDFQPAGRTLNGGDAQPAKVITLTPRARTASGSTAGAAGSAGAGAASRLHGPDIQELELAARYFADGSELDCGDEAQQDAAMAAYRHALLLDPGMVAAFVNLANLHYGRDAIVEAEVLYEKALALDDGCFEALFNLGNVLHDTGRFDAAVGLYEQALAIDPAYADAHFYLAVALEKLGRSADARPHWQAYQRLAPEGEWVELAKEFSSQS